MDTLTFISNLPIQTVASIIAITIAVLTGLSAIFKSDSERKKNVAESAASLTLAAEKVVSIFEIRINDLETRIDYLEDFQNILERWGDSLITLVDSVIRYVTDTSKAAEFKKEATYLKERRPVRRRAPHTPTHIDEGMIPSDKETT